MLQFFVGLPADVRQEKIKNSLKKNLKDAMPKYIYNTRGNLNLAIYIIVSKTLELTVSVNMLASVLASNS
jgi:hypothetical protein